MPNLTGKLIMLVVWGVLAANFFVDYPVNLDTWLYVLGGLLVVIHLALCGVFADRVRRHHSNTAVGFMMIFLFGIIHVGQWH